MRAAKRAWTDEDTRKVIDLKDNADLSYSQIAKMIGRNQSMVGKMYRRAKGLDGMVERKAKKTNEINGKKELQVSSICFDCQNAYGGKCEWIDCDNEKVSAVLENKGYYKRYDYNQRCWLYSITDCPEFKEDDYREIRLDEPFDNANEV